MTGGPSNPSLGKSDPDKVRETLERNGATEAEIDFLLGDDDPARKIHRNRFDLWREEIFEPFLHWVSAELARAHKLNIFEWRRNVDADRRRGFSVATRKNFAFLCSLFCLSFAIFR